MPIRRTPVGDPVWTVMRPGRALLEGDVFIVSVPSYVVRLRENDRPGDGGDGSVGLKKARDLGRIGPDPCQKVPGRDETRLDLVLFVLEGAHWVHAGRPGANGEALPCGFHLIRSPPQQRA